MTATKPIGQRFSHVYLDRKHSLKESNRARIRILGLFSSNVLDILKYNRLIQQKIGAIINVSSPHEFNKFISAGDIVDVLDFITVFYEYLRKSQDLSYATSWRDNIRLIFEEEGMGYSVDDKGGVHFLIDKEFHRNQSSTLSNLDQPRYNAAAASYQDIQTALDSVPPDGKMAIRHTFEAAEILFRLICPKAPRLGGAEINTHLKPLVETLYSGDQTACRASMKLLASFSDWVDGAHFYRHGQGTEEPTQAPLEIAVLAISMGASFIRWLAEIDQALLKKQTTGA